jgi:hypothetical protein
MIGKLLRVGTAMRRALSIAERNANIRYRCEHMDRRGRRHNCQCSQCELYNTELREMVYRSQEFERRHQFDGLLSYGLDGSARVSQALRSATGSARQPMAQRDALRYIGAMRLLYLKGNGWDANWCERMFDGLLSDPFQTACEIYAMNPQEPDLALPYVGLRQSRALKVNQKG